MLDWFAKLIDRFKRDPLAAERAFEQEVDGWTAERVKASALALLNDPSQFRCRVSPVSSAVLPAELGAETSEFFGRYASVLDVGTNFVLTRPTRGQALTKYGTLLIGSDFGGDFTFGVVPGSDRVFELDSEGGGVDLRDSHLNVWRLLLWQARRGSDEKGRI
jgi:hypothetical protein